MKIVTALRCLKEVVVDRNPKYAAYILWKLAKGDETLRIDYPLGADSTVLDVGGFRGEWAAKIVDRYHCRLIVFEPVSSHVAIIKERFSDETSVEVVTAGLAGCTRKATITLEAEGSSTLLEGQHAETIQLLDVVDVFAEFELEEVSLMKINIEGGEYELLERMYNAGLMSKIRFFQIQFHDFIEDAHTRLSSIRKILSESHQMNYCYSFVWEGWERR